MEDGPMKELDPFKEQLIGDAKNLYEQAENDEDRIILSTALMRWGVPVVTSQLEKSGRHQNKRCFVFFVAGMFSVLPHPFFKLIDKIQIAKFYYYCPAYNSSFGKPCLETISSELIHSV
jgi:hypothetical protein